MQETRKKAVKKPESSKVGKCKSPKVGKPTSGRKRASIAICEVDKIVPGVLVFAEMQRLSESNMSLSDNRKIISELWEKWAAKR